MDIKTEYIRDYIPVPIPGFNADLSIQYSQFITDSVLTRMGYEVMFGVANPFPHMTRQSASIRMTDFFISTPTDYSKASEKSLRFEFDMKPMEI
jgi:ribonucleotide reductase beta subunit family protein with ferritin-like domain